jgi:hypothetical protein
METQKCPAICEARRIRSNDTMFIWNYLYMLSEILRTDAKVKLFSDAESGEN